MGGLLIKALLIAAVGLTLLVYAPVRQAGFAYEDDVYARPAQQPLTLQSVLQPRGLTALTFRWNAIAHVTDPRGYHGVNLFLHLLVGLSVFAVAKLLLPTPYALLAATLMLIHPLNSEAVAYIAGRAELIAALGVLGVVWALAQPVVTWTHVGVALIAAVAAIGGKELGVMALPLAGLYTVVIRKPAWSWRWIGWSVAGLALLGVLLWPILSVRMLGNLYLLQGEKYGLGYLCYQSAALWTYVKLAIVPIGLSVDHDFDGLTKAWALTSAGAGLMVLIAAWLVRARWPVITLGVWWTVIALLPRFVVPIPELLRESQTYTAFIGVWLALAASVMHLATWVATKEPIVCAESGSVSSVSS